MRACVLLIIFAIISTSCRSTLSRPLATPLQTAPKLTDSLFAGDTSSMNPVRHELQTHLNAQLQEEHFLFYAISGLKVGSQRVLKTSADLKDIKEDMTILFAESSFAHSSYGIQIHPPKSSVAKIHIIEYHRKPSGGLSISDQLVLPFTTLHTQPHTFMAQVQANMNQLRSFVDLSLRRRSLHEPLVKERERARIYTGLAALTHMHMLRNLPPERRVSSSLECALSFHFATVSVHDERVAWPFFPQTDLHSFAATCLENPTPILTSFFRPLLTY